MIVGPRWDGFLKKLPERFCRRCKSPYKPQARMQKYCTEACTEAARRERERAQRVR